MIYFNTFAKLKNKLSKELGAELYAKFNISESVVTSSENVEFKEVAIIYAILKLDPQNSEKLTFLSKIIKQIWPDLAGLEKIPNYTCYPLFESVNQIGAKSQPTKDIKQPKKVEESLDSLF